MAQTSGRKTPSTRQNSGKQVPANRKFVTGQEKQYREKTPEDRALFHEITLIVLFVATILLFLCNFHIIGGFGDFLSGIQFGFFGFTAYFAPIIIFLMVAFWMANAGKKSAGRKLASMIILFILLGVICEMIIPSAGFEYNMFDIYANSKNQQTGGGIIGGSIAYLMLHFLDDVGTILVLILLIAICLVILTERSLINLLKNGGKQIKDKGIEDYNRRKEYNRQRREMQEEENQRFLEEQRAKQEEMENESILRMEKKVSGVMMDTEIKPQKTDTYKADIHEIAYRPNEEADDGLAEEEELLTKKTASDVHPLNQVIEPQRKVSKPLQQDFDFTQHDNIRIHKEGKTEEPQNVYPENKFRETETVRETEPVRETETVRPQVRPVRENIRPEVVKQEPQPQTGERMSTESQPVPANAFAPEKKIAKKYMFPPLSRLQKGKGTVGDSSQELKETALRLQQTLNTFGVKVTVTDISQGPSVTRYELQPEQGVKVSKIVGLTDDIKLNLAATDIRIEAPIPGKAAVGIEVPNKENQMVALRDLLESKEFRDFPSNLAFAVGKDIGGKTVVTDIAKMPHMLIAGSTGSGKSVCINTLIMSILYKAHPDDVKLIMVDPKVVELSVYNGIPHLLIPVVTDPKKASAALHWAVTEMEDRYRKFADFNVRDLKGYNKKIEELQENATEPVPNKLPQIVIIVDELADLMMVSPGEVEESICRLAQLARACGIHLIIATQRPSVDVITGLIKANMPSRVAFAVSSGVDSRTILDQVGAEKLLGKGDMLFYPQGYSKPARIQGAFVSDSEVSDVVDFLKNQAIGNVYAADIEDQIKNIGNQSAQSGSGAQGGSESALDEYFAEAGRFIIDKDKASIGSLQRLLKIGFNRAARIMDQLCEYGVVGEEEGTKPRKVLMSIEQFEQLLEEI